MAEQHINLLELQMKNLIRAAGGCLALLFVGQVNAQEITVGSYVGALEGAAQACAEAFPGKAPIYRDSLYRSMKCHMGPDELAQWHKTLRTKPPHSAQYREGFATGKASVGASDSQRLQNCGSLERLACDPRSRPDPLK